MYRHRRELWNLGRRSLARFLFLGTSTSRKVTKIHRAGYTFPLSSLDARLLADQGSGIIQDLYTLFTLNTACNTFLFIFLHGGQPYVENDKVSNIKKKKKRKKKKRRNGRYLLRRVVSSWVRFSAVGSRPSLQAARRLSVTKL